MYANLWKLITLKINIYDRLWLIASIHGLKKQTNLPLGSGCGSVGIAVASNTRGPRFESSHRQTFIFNICLLWTVLKSRKLRKNRPGMAHLKSKLNLPISVPTLISVQNRGRQFSSHYDSRVVIYNHNVFCKIAHKKCRYWNGTWTYHTLQTSVNIITIAPTHGQPN